MVLDSIAIMFSIIGFLISGVALYKGFKNKTSFFDGVWYLIFNILFVYAYFFLK